MGQVYTAKSVAGVVFMVSASGQTRTLKAGDRILTGETLITGARGRVELVAEDAPPIHLDGDRQIRIDDNLFATTADKPATAAVVSGSIERVIDTLAGTGDLNDELEAPAAGAAAGAGREGSSFVRLLRVSEGVDPLAFSFNTRLSDIPVELDSNAPPQDDVPAVAVTVDPRNPDVFFVPDEAVFESALPQGNGGGTRQTSGQFLVDGGGNGLKSLQVGGVDVTQGGEVVGAHGTLVVTLEADGSYRWVYTLNAPTIDAPGQDETDVFVVLVTDQDGDTAAANLTVLIIDDQPIARPDENAVAEGATLVVPATEGVLINDRAGADGWAANGAAVVGVVPGDDTTRNSTTGVGANIVGQYGTLTLNADGSYTYVAHANSTGVDAEDVFVYTVLDGDGDLVSTTLTIKIGNVDAPAPPPPPPPPPAAAEDTVYEAGLPTGTDAASNSETVSGTVTLPTGWTAVPVSGTTPFGSYVINADGSYTYTLTAAATDIDQASVAETDVINFQMTDGLGNQVTNTLTITIIDDVPTVTVEAAGSAPTLTVDETALGVPAAVSFAAAFSATSAHGADGPGGLTSLFSLSVPAEGTNSGLLDTATGQAVLLRATATGVEGYLASGEVVFTVEVNATTGVVTLTQERALHHPIDTDHNDPVSLANGLITLTRTDTITDADGDTAVASASVDLGSHVVFLDDGIGGNNGEGLLVTLDETDNLGTAVLATDTAFPSPIAGADGVLPDLGYVLSATDGAPTGLWLTGQSDPAQQLLVHKVSDTEYQLLSGDTATLALSVTIDPTTGDVTMTQHAPLEHRVDGASAAAQDDVLSLTGLFDVVRTARDGDNDSVEQRVALDIDVHDDGPRFIGSNGGGNNGSAAPSLLVDETQLGVVVHGRPSSGTSSNYDLGADGPGAVPEERVYVLTLPESGADSGLVDTATGERVRLVLNGGVVEGRTETTDALVVTLATVSPNDMQLALTQFRAVEHPNAADDNDLVRLASGLINLQLTQTITDGDGDTAVAINSWSISQDLGFLDDGPSISVEATSSALTLSVDETTLGVAASASFAALFGSTPVYGADGAGSVSSAYVLGVPADGTDSGLLDTATGQAVLLRATATGVEAYLASGEVVFTVEVNATTGVVTLTQERALHHPDDTDHNDPVGLDAGLITLTRSDTTTDGDGDTAVGQASADLGSHLVFLDDGIGGNNGAGVLATLDETDGLDTVVITAAAVTAALPAPIAGADGVLPDMSYTLKATDGGATGLWLTGHSDPAQALLVHKVSDTAYELRSGDTNTLALSVTIDPATGEVTVTQHATLEHMVDGATASDHNDVLNLTGLFEVVRTAHDGDGDSVAQSMPLSIEVRDDGPGFSGGAGGNPGGGSLPLPTMLADETQLGTTFYGQPRTTQSVGPNFGADGPGEFAITYSLSVASSGVNSGLVDTASGEAVLLRMNGDTVEGYTATGNERVFSLGLTTSSQTALELTQYRAVEHPDGINPDDLVRLAADLIQMNLSAWVTDGDGDSATTTQQWSVSQDIGFRDDGPTIDVEASATVPTLTVDETALGVSAAMNFAAAFSGTPAYGADGPGHLTSVFSLSVPADGTDSGLRDTATGQAVLLRVTASGAEGYLASGEVVFTVALDSTTGKVTLTQSRALYHPDNADPNDPVSLDGDVLLLSRTDTIIDGDGDHATGSAELDLGTRLVFLDDGIGGNNGEGLRVQLDETGGLDSVVIAAAAVAGTFPAPMVGADGVLPISSYALSGTDGASTGLWLSGQSGPTQELRVVKVDDATYELRVAGSGGMLALMVHIDPATGEVHVTQYAPLEHPLDGPTAADHDDLLNIVGLFTVERTLTDGDGDSLVQRQPLRIEVRDDGPTALVSQAAVVSNLSGSVVTGLLLDQSDGDIVGNFGADGPGQVRFSASLNGAQALDVDGDPLMSGGLPVTYHLSADGVVLTASTVLGQVFEVRLDVSTGTYAVQVTASVDGGTPAIDFNAGGYNFVGGNGSWAGFNTSANDNSRDLLITPMTGGVSGGTINANANTGGVSAGASVDTGEAVRVDFVIDLRGAPVPGGGGFGVPANQTQQFDQHYTVNGSSALINVGGAASNTSSVTLRAFDDNDAGVNPFAVGDGLPDRIVGVSVGYRGSESLVLTNLGASQTVNVGGVNFTVSFDAGGHATVSGVRDGTTLGAYTADGYNSLEFAHAGGRSFSLGDFGTASVTPGVPVDLALPIGIVDADGDAAASNLSLTLEPLNLSNRQASFEGGSLRLGDVLDDGSLDTVAWSVAPQTSPSGGSGDAEWLQSLGTHKPWQPQGNDMP